MSSETSSNKFSLRSLLEEVSVYWKLFLRNWLLIGIVSAAFMFGFYFKSKKRDIEFIATQTFMVKEDEGGGSLFTNLLGQFGLKSGGPKGEYNLDKLVEIAKSRRIITRSLFEKCVIDGQEDLLINHFIRIYKLEDHPDVKQDPEIKFTKFKKFTREENRAILLIYGHIVGAPKIKPKMSINYNDESGVIYITFVTRSEELSLNLTRLVYKNISSFYIDQASEKQALTLEQLENKRDSLHSILHNKELEFARMKDQGYGVILQQNKVKQARLKSEITLLNTMYTEVLKNVENAAFSLKNSTPVFQPIDSPEFPLVALIKSNLLAAFRGFVLGLVLAILFLVGRRLVQEELKKE